MRGLLLLLLLWGSLASARTVVLVHGFASGPGVWYSQGVVQALNGAGFADGGILPDLPNRAAVAAPDVVLAVRMPWWLPLQQQAHWLQAVLQRVYRRRHEPVILVGHSSGGVVARFYSLAPARARVPVSAVVTVASPNLGTPLARLAWAMLRSPMGRALKSMDGRSARLYAARRLLWQLRSDGPVMHWMNRMRHPEGVRYVSLVHTRRLDMRRGDFGLVVPPKYQDLRRVPALSGRARSIPVSAGHRLSRRDGWALAALMRRF